MKQDPDNVEIGNPTFMYEPQLNEDDGPQLVDTAFTVKGIKVLVHCHLCVLETLCLSVCCL